MIRQLNGQLVCNSNWLSRLRISVISVSCEWQSAVRKRHNPFPQNHGGLCVVQPVFWIKSEDIHIFGEGILLYSVSV